MKKFKVMLARTSIDYCEVTVMAESFAEAQDKAIDDHMGEHDWQDSQTIEISACEENGDLI